jgi:CelD/BcsL family acetyltransferase involved in cellulose biosynthesis
MGDRLVGLVPAYVPDTSTAENAALTFIGIGNSDYLDVLVDPDFIELSSDRIQEYLSTPSANWNEVHFEPLRSESNLVARWRVGRDLEMRSSITQLEYCPVLKLGEMASFSKAIPHRQFENWRYYLRRAERLGTLEFELAGPENWRDSLSSLLRLHSIRWNARGAAGVLAEGAVRQFHWAAAEGMLKLGILRLYVLRLNSRPISALYGFQHRKRFYFYLGGFDPEFSTLSPGTLLLGHAISQAIRERATEFDFLRGQERYKYLWGAKDTACHRLTVRLRPLELSAREAVALVH